MAIELISKIKPKNGGKFPLVDGEDIAVIVPANENYDATGSDGTTLRRSFHLGNTIRLDGHDGYRINSLGIRAAAGTTVRFALYAVEPQEEGSGVLTQLSILGEAVADEETQVAQLTFEDGYHVDRDNTIILAFAREAALHCYQLAEGLALTGTVQFEDADYFDNEDGTQIAYSSSQTGDEGAIAVSMFARDIDFFVEQRLDDYIKGNEKRLEEAAESGAVPTFDLAAMGLSTVYPTDSYAYLQCDTTEIREALDKGAVKFVIPVNMGAKANVTAVMTAMQVNGEYACVYSHNVYGEVLFVAVTVVAGGVSVAITPMVNYINAYMEEALGGDY